MANAPDGGVHQHAYIEEHGRFVGTRGIMNLWNPNVYSTRHFSLSQIWLSGGIGDYRNVIEVGWHVYPTIHRDYLTHLFVASTANNYQDWGYNEDAIGWVTHDTSRFQLRQILPTSETGQVEIQFDMSQDLYNQMWWVKLDGSHIGGFRMDYFPEIRSYANCVQWGGEVCATTNSPVSLWSDMGNGVDPIRHQYSDPCYIRGIRVMEDHDYEYRPINPLHMVSTYHQFYNIVYVPREDKYYYGGRTI